MKKKVTKTLTMENKLTAFDVVNDPNAIPTQLEPNRFYVFHSKTGNIGFGTIIGKNASSSTTLVESDMFGVAELWGTLEQRASFKYNNDFIIFFDYQQLYNAVSAFFMKYKNRIISKKTRKMRYLVHKDTFFCKTSSITTKDKYFHYFDTKKEAVEYAEKHLPIFFQKVLAFLEEAKGLKGEIERLVSYAESDYEFNCPDIYDRLYQYQVEPSKLKLGDEIIKADRIRDDYENINIYDFDKDYCTMVKEPFNCNSRRYQYVKLSDGTLLVEGSTKHYHFPMFFNKNDYDAVDKLISIASTRRMDAFCKDVIQRAQAAANYAKSYTPFKKNIPQCYYYESFFKNGIKDLKTAIKKYKEKLRVD